MSDDPRPPTVEYATPARETRRGSRTLVIIMLVALLALAALAGVMTYLLMARSTVTVQVAPAPPAPAVPGAPAPGKPPTLSLPSDPLRMTLRQREERYLPGSNNTISLHVDDITRGQVLISLTGADGTSLIDNTSVRHGDSVTFTVKGGKTYVLDVLELHNTLTGGDFVVLSIATPGKRPTTTTAPATIPSK